MRVPLPCTAVAVDPSRARWWAPGDVTFRLEVDRPALESWDAAGSPSQLRLAEYLERLAPAETAVRSLAGPGWLDLDVVLPATQELLSGSDVENFLAPVVRRFGPSHFVLVTGRKRHPRVAGERSRLTIGSATRGEAPASPLALRIEGSYANPAWKAAIRGHLLACGVHEVPRGPVTLALGLRCATEGRNWLSLWKPAGDALGPLLGEPRADKPFHPADDRVVELAYHLCSDPTMGWAVELAAACGALNRRSDVVESP